MVEYKTTMTLEHCWALRMPSDFCVDPGMCSFVTCSADYEAENDRSENFYKPRRSEPI